MYPSTLIKIRMAPSPVWLYFEKTNDGRVKCTKCKQVYKFNKSTTSLSSHLKSMHKIDLKNTNDEDGDLVENDSENAAVAFLGPLARSFGTAAAYTVNGTKYKSMLNALLFMIVKDGMPLRTTQKEGFRMFCKKLQPLYRPPSVATITNSLKIKYEEVFLKIKTEIREAHYVCLTTDIWTHKHTMQSYLGVTVHYVKDLNLKTVEVGAYPMDERKTIENLRIKLREICDEMELEDDQILAVVSDGGANIKGAVKQEFGEARHVSCFGHSINNIGQKLIEINTSVPAADVCPLLDESSETIGNVTDELLESDNISPLRQLLRKVKSIVKFFRTSEVATNALKARQIEVGNKEYLKLIQEVKTRWNSCYDMVDRFLHLSHHVGMVLLHIQRERSSRSKPPDMLTGDDLEALAEVRTILRPLWQITLEVSAEKVVTLSKCIPLIVGLRNKISTFLPTTAIGRKLNENLLREINEKFYSIESVRLYALATLLDPRFKKRGFHNAREAARYIGVIGDIIKSDMQKTRNLEAEEPEDVVCTDVSETDPNDLWYYLDCSLGGTNLHGIEDEMGIPAQLRQYISAPVIPRKINPNPFLCWKKMVSEYPQVWKVAKKALPIVATSVPCERLFSHAGLIASQLRSRLSPSNLNMLVFLRSVDEAMWFPN